MILLKDRPTHIGAKSLFGNFFRLVKEDIFQQILKSEGFSLSLFRFKKKSESGKMVDEGRGGRPIDLI